MGRIVGVDYGIKRVGVAVTDPLQLIASPLKTVATAEAIPFLQGYNKHNSVVAIVLGWPLALNGTATTTTRLVGRFMRLLKRHLSTLPLYAYDERLTSVIAQKSRKEAGIPQQKRKDKTALDAISAALILQSFLNHPNPESLRC